MLRLKCPTQEGLLEYFTIAKELSLVQRTRTKVHLLYCSGCKEKLSVLHQSWERYFSPEPDLTASLMRVYSKLQKDETLILKGWKLGETTRRRGADALLLNGGWLFRGGVSVGLAAIVMMVIMTQNNRTKSDAQIAQNHGPYAQIRMEDKNSVKVHYLQPELLQTIEFETTRSR